MRDPTYTQERNSQITGYVEITPVKSASVQECGRRLGSQLSVNRCFSKFEFSAHAFGG
jgi:hypothetical protein